MKILATAFPRIVTLRKGNELRYQAALVLFKAWASP